MRTGIRCISLAIIAVCTFLGDVSHVRADWYFPLVRITCVPEADYAAIETFGLYNIAISARPVPPTLAAAGIYELRSLAEKPVTCQLRRGALQIEVIRYHPPMPSGECGGVEDADLRLSWNGKQVGIVQSTHGGCTASRRHYIEFSESQIQHCVLSFQQPVPMVGSTDFVDVPAKCRRIPTP